MDYSRNARFRRWLPFIFVSSLAFAFILCVMFYVFPKFEKKIVKVLKDRSLFLVSFIYDVVNNMYRTSSEGKVDLKKAKYMASLVLRNTRYGESEIGYFWVISSDGRIIVHPHYPQLEGKKPEEIEDKDLRRHFKVAVGSILKAFEEGKNFAEYEWYVSGKGVSEKELSVFRYFEPWDWIIGTGVYEMDIRGLLNEEKMSLIKLSWIFSIVLVPMAFLLERVMRRAEIKESKLLEQILREKSRMDTLISNMPAPVAMKDVDLRYVYVNEAFSKFCGKDPNEIVGKTDGEIFGEDTARKLRKYDEEALKALKPVFYEFKREISGKLSWFVCREIPIVRPDEKVDGIICVLNEITGLKREVMKLRNEADRDPLTGLANRNFLKKLKKDPPNKLVEGRFAVVMLDLDGFKAVNDTYGHVIGDLALVEVSRRIENSVRKDTLVIRYGGDEFLLITSIEDRSEVEIIVQRILENISSGMVISGTSVEIEASAGISLYPDDGLDLDILIEKADQALYRIKSISKGSYSFYNQNASGNT